MVSFVDLILEMPVLQYRNHELIYTIYTIYIQLEALNLPWINGPKINLSEISNLVEVFPRSREV